LKSVIHSLQEAKGRIGLSVSGLEATAEPKWLEHLSKTIAAQRDIFDEVVVYSNGSGIADPKHRDGVLRSLRAMRTTRIELSRHHWNESTNQEIMRFRSKTKDGHAVVVRLNTHFEAAARRLVSELGVTTRMVCILTQAGVRDIDGVESYLDWAYGLGIRDVVFRELCQFEPGTYRLNATAKWIDQNVVEADGLRKAVLPSLESPRRRW